MNQIKPLLSLFNKIAPNENRLKVFSDFVMFGAIAYQNQACFSQSLEDRYLCTINRYSKVDIERLCSLLAELTMALHDAPRDYLGQMYMELEISNKRIGQMFTPHHLQTLIARMIGPDIHTEIEHNGYTKLSEPSVGSGGMVIEFAHEMIQQGYKPNKQLFVLAADIDINAVYMTYLQLAILNIPAQVLHSNTLSLEVWSTFTTPALYTDQWAERLSQKDTELNPEQLLEAV